MRNQAKQNGMINLVDSDMGGDKLVSLHSDMIRMH